MHPDSASPPPPATGAAAPTRRGTALRWLTALLALAGGAASATPAPAEAAPPIARLDAIRQRLLDADRAAAPAPGDDRSPDGQAGETGQWFNWPNWANWSKWSKWNNWNNWGKQ
jgi:hypothetical protein